MSCTVPRYTSTAQAKPSALKNFVVLTYHQHSACSTVLKTNNSTFFYIRFNFCFTGVYFGQESPRLKNFHSFETLDEATPITSLSWADDTQKEVLVGFENHAVKVYNTKLRSFTKGIQLTPIDGRVISVDAYLK